MNLKITGTSTAMFATWFFVDELRTLFDCGDGVTMGLGPKAGKVKQVFISHADRDHITGLLPFHQLNAKQKTPKIYFPKDSGSFPALQEFIGKFDPHKTLCPWIPMECDSSYQIGKTVEVRTIRNEHVPSPLTKSLSFRVEETKRVVKPELRNLPKEEIQKIALSKGSEFLTQGESNTLLAYSGDTPVTYDGRWEGCQTLIHECTFLGAKADSKLVPKLNEHSFLTDLIESLVDTDVEQLILSHFSIRYDRETILREVRKAIRDFNIKIPVFGVFPGTLNRDILSSAPIN